MKEKISLNSERQENKNELTQEEKRSLAQSWANIVIGRNNIPEDLDKMSNRELRQWMSEELLTQMKEIVKSLGLSDVIEGVNDEQEKINKVFNAMDNIAKNLENTRWHSWPTLIKESKKFNCVGSALIAKVILEKAGINVLIANPEGHVANIIQTSNNKYIYFDPRNGKMVEIEPEILEVGNRRVFKINNKKIKYKAIKILEDADLPKPILGNLESLRQEAQDKTILNSPDQEDAKRIFNEHRGLFDKINYLELIKKLFPEVVAVGQMDIVEEEKERMDILMGYHEPARKFILSLGKRKIKQMKRELKDRKEDVVLYFEENKASLSGLSDEAQELLRIYKEELNKLKIKNINIYKEIKEDILNSLSPL